MDGLGSAMQDSGFPGTALKKIKRNFESIVAAAKHNLSNARMEATNNKIKLVIRVTFGFRNEENMISMVMLTCADVRPRLPGR